MVPQKLLITARFIVASKNTGVSERWLQEYINQKYTSIDHQVNVKDKEKGTLAIQCDEMWSFVSNKENKQWIWLAIDIITGEIVGVYVGSRDRSGALGLWDSLPGVYRHMCRTTLTFISYQIKHCGKISELIAFVIHVLRRPLGIALHRQ